MAWLRRLLASLRDWMNDAGPAPEGTRADGEERTPFDPADDWSDRA